MKQFREAVEAQDHAVAEALLADDVVFTSPVAFKPYRGKRVTAAILQGVSRVLEDFEYVRTVDDVGGRDFVLFFTARIGDVTVHGCDTLHVDESGKIDDFMVMVRPLSAASALADRMAHEFTAVLAAMAEGAP